MEQGSRAGQIAVIFVSQRSGADPEGYAAAAAAMEARAAGQPGYRGMDSARGADGLGITISWWADEAAALAWRADADHRAIRERGRAVWYDAYEVAVGTVTRSYGWERGGGF
ncbi:antibiotic biosynthesis monooxygenase family protein [Sphingomonas sp. 1P08PE]|uniref:antibiotic biosynthesis monooxygenase family protein n=1 Tax=Sphingomonas sp. 1P08PE TaxID=554122 RepID=UPI0039A24DD9